MSEPLPMQRDVFRYYVKEALTNLYDRTHLQTSPLLDVLPSEDTRDGVASASLRQVLREAIDWLRPDVTIPPSRPEWLGYRLLWLRYVHRKSRFAVCQELNISRTSYYRYHQQALDAVASMLWERSRERAASRPASGEGSGPEEADKAIQTAVKLARESPRQPVDVLGLVEGVLRTLRPLAEEQSVRLGISASPALPPLHVNAWMLRQALLSLLLDAMENRDDDRIDIEIVQEPQCLLWRLRGLSGNLVGSRGVTLAREVIGVYGGQLAFESDIDNPVFSFALPIAKQRSILIVDDDKDTIRLYRQWLQASDYLVSAARTRAELADRLAASRPDLVLLDVLMPQWDGWSVLQVLKLEPRTADIPIIICSVLSQPKLALALGASAVLCKPLTEAKLIQAVGAALHPQDNVE